jgi:CRISPR-associated protein Csb1
VIERLSAIVENDAAIRRVLEMQPAGGQGDKIAPPTYLGSGRGEGARHAFEHRRVGDANVLTALVDSVASQANRLEVALVDLLRERSVHVPRLEVDFSATRADLELVTDGKMQKVVFGKGVSYDLSDLGTISSFEAPHRVYDAIFRDSEIVEDGTPLPFHDSELFASLKLAKPQNATVMFGLVPAALLFGSWNSTGSGGGLGAKFARCITAEIVGYGVAGKPEIQRDGQTALVADGVRVGSRLDPLGIRKDAEVVGGPTDWNVAAGSEKGRHKPSDINHSNIPPTIEAGGVSVEFLRQTVVLSCAGLRRLRFPGTRDENAGRTVLAALALVAVLAQDRAGYALRSRCDLAPAGPGRFEVVHADGSISPFDLNLDEAVAAYGAAVDAARAAGFPWSERPTSLRPQAKLVQLVALSRARGLAGEREDDEQ